MKGSLSKSIYINDNGTAVFNCSSVMYAWSELKSPAVEMASQPGSYTEGCWLNPQTQ